MSRQLDKVWQTAGRAGGVAKHAIAAHPRASVGVAAAAVAVCAVGWYVTVRRRPSAEEMERRRRERLSAIGRLTDGSIVDALSREGEQSYSATAEVLLYRYRIAGVTYDCAQDVSSLVQSTVGHRVDQPVQVRYDPLNPGNSIIVSESWSGLRASGFRAGEVEEVPVWQRTGGTRRQDDRAEQPQTRQELRQAQPVTREG